MQRIRAERDFIGADWVDEDDEDDEDGEAGTTKSVRLLDYACGTGNISRVRKEAGLHWSYFSCSFFPRTRRAVAPLRDIR